MPIVVNTNASATEASFNLSRANDQLRKSLSRLSSGDRITNPAEDAGGMAVAYKLDSKLKRTEAVLNNHQNALSYLQVQDGALKTVGNIVTRMSELRTMAADVTKNSDDIENYSKEFRELQTQLGQMALEKFNGISLFAKNGHTSSEALSGKLINRGTGSSSNDIYSYTLYTHPSGTSADGNISLNVINMQWLTTLAANVDHDDNSTTAAVTADLSKIDQSTGIQNISSVSISEFTAIIQKVADARAENGAEQQRVLQSYDLHSQNMVNLDAARGRIMDTDIALESTRFARYNVLVQASASMTAQANQMTNIALTLLQ